MEKPTNESKSPSPRSKLFPKNLTNRQRRFILFAAALLLGISCAFVPVEYQLVCKKVVKLVAIFMG